MLIRFTNINLKVSTSHEWHLAVFHNHPNNKNCWIYKTYSIVSYVLVSSSSMSREKHGLWFIMLSTYALSQNKSKWTWHENIIWTPSNLFHLGQGFLMPIHIILEGHPFCILQSDEFHIGHTLVFIHSQPWQLLLDLFRD